MLHTIILMGKDNINEHSFTMIKQQTLVKIVRCKNKIDESVFDLCDSHYQ